MNQIVADALERETFVVWDMGNGESRIVSSILSKDNRYQVIREIAPGCYPLQLYSR